MSSSLKLGGVTIGGRVWIAPMTGVSDLPFRRAASRLGAAYVATEMVACAEFSKGRPDVVRRAAVGEGLPLMVVQLVGRNPEHIAQGARLAEAAGAQIIDLNFGCPAREVTGAQCGSALMREPELAERLIASAIGAALGELVAGDHLGGHVSRAQAAGRPPERQVRHPGHRRDPDTTGDLDIAELERTAHFIIIPTARFLGNLCAAVKPE